MIDGAVGSEGVDASGHVKAAVIETNIDMSCLTT